MTGRGKSSIISQTKLLSAVLFKYFMSVHYDYFLLPSGFFPAVNEFYGEKSVKDII